MTKNILASVTDNVALSILSELKNKRIPLSVYDFNDMYSLSKYRYFLRKLRLYLVLNSFKKGKRIYYNINPYYDELISNLLNLNQDLKFDAKEIEYPVLIADETSKSLVTILKDIKGWALTGPSALMLLVPFLNLSAGYYSICVQSPKVKQKIYEYLPHSLVNIEVQPTYFIKNKSIEKLKNFYILAPDVLLFQLLKHHNTRIQLASIFLLPYINSETIFTKINNDQSLFPIFIYLLFTLQEYIKEIPQSSPLKMWFYNIDQYDEFLFFEHYVKFLSLKKNHRRRGINPPKSNLNFSLLRKQWKKQNNSYDKWDKFAEIFNENNTIFNPNSIESLYSTTDFYSL